jgi:hypothetical protein
VTRRGPIPLCRKLLYSLLAPLVHWSALGNCLLARELAVAVTGLLPDATLSPSATACNEESH